MPVAKPRSEDDRVNHVIVKRRSPLGESVLEKVQIVEPVVSTLDGLPPLAQLGVRDKDYDSDDDDQDGEGRGPPPPLPLPPPTTIVITKSLTQAQATNPADQTTVETIVFTPTPNSSFQGPPPGEHHPKGISQTTEHLLIAAGSIGATIIVVMVILAIHTMRKRGLTLREAVHYGKYQVTRRGPPPPPPKSWDNKQSFGTNYGSMRNNTVTPPPRAMSVSRSGSISSQRPLMALQRSESFSNRQATNERTASPSAQQSFLLESPVGSASHRRDNSRTPSSPVLPLQTQRRSNSTRNTRSMSEASELKYPEPPVDRALSPLPPPPTFKQFLNNRPSASNRPGLAGMVSRFSWTNSNAPQTPHDPNRDTNAFLVGRDSFMTQRSSVPRFRTVDSWVNQQANRIEEQKLKEQYRLTQTSTEYSEDDERDVIPKVPELPSTVVAEASASTLETGTPAQAMPTTTTIPTTPAPPQSGSLPGKNIKHERHDTRTTVDTAPIFRQHPGTEVRFSTRSAVPSEILDMGRKNNILS